jgi:hypothetical protein
MMKWIRNKIENKNLNMPSKKISKCLFIIPNFRPKFSIYLTINLSFLPVKLSSDVDETIAIIENLKICLDNSAIVFIFIRFFRFFLIMAQEH